MDITGYGFITGGGGGIGSASCKALAKAGVRGLLIADLSLQAAEKVASEAQAVATSPVFRAIAIHIDVTLEESVSHAIAHMIESFKRIDFCVHCAGIPGGTFDEVSSASFEDFKHLLEVNVQGTFLVTSQVLAKMRLQEPKQLHPTQAQRGLSRGTLVNMASLMSYMPLPGMVQYVTSKHAVMGISKTAALENVAHNIRVNCVCPSYVDTPMVTRATEVVPGLEQNILSGIPMGRLATADEVADVVLFLCSPMSSYMTGCGLVVDGGMSISTSAV
ncbi:NAD(P)-binding protein [Annulohypoxylon nitens]|nr:NAD(P)-binding protein [Annulohypoxylon nitens]